MIIRIDDFPTGISTVPDDLSDYFRILDCFEHHGIQYHLGIVPELLRRFVNSDDIERLTRYRCMVPVMHGYDHQFDRMNRILTANDDQQNTRNLVSGVFYEFESRTQEWVNDHLTQGREYLENVFNRIIVHYIPVCNRIDDKLITGLINSGFVYIFTIDGNRRQAQRMETINTEYYGSLENMTRRYESLCLHITNEVWSLHRIGFHEWKRQFHKMIA